VGPIAFGAPAYLWLLVVPAALLLLWGWRVVRRVGELRRLRAARLSAVPERWSALGDLPFWLCVTIACALLLVALARPRGVAPSIGRVGLDIIVLQDGSASMYVEDTPSGTRWVRSMTFLRRLGDALRWDDDRLALSVFAKIATPQVRLTRDPNTVFFFLDHLDDRPPFRIEDITTWDTNMEQGIAWGLRLLEKDREIHGRSANAPLFVLLSDGEVWSGEVARAISKIREAGVPLYVVGVGTLGGGALPQVAFPDEEEPPPSISHLDRRGLQRVAAEGGGEYFELDRDQDREIANAIIDAGRRSAPPKLAEAAVTELYWRVLAAACAVAGAGVVFLRHKPALGLQLAGAVVALLVALRLLW
jgi:Ca-activated chloride channel family protein